MTSDHLLITNVSTLELQAVITVVFEDSLTNEIDYHAVTVSKELFYELHFKMKAFTFDKSLLDTQSKVTLKEAKMESGKMTLTVIDSKSKAAESVIEVPVLGDGTLQIGGKKDQLCLGDKFCFFLKL